MTTKRQYKTYTKEFKEEAVKLIQTPILTFSMKIKSGCLR